MVMCGGGVHIIRLLPFVARCLVEDGGCLILRVSNHVVCLYRGCDGCCA